MKPKESLKMVWSEFQESTSSFLANIHSSHDFSDVTLACDDDEVFPAHRVILSAGSSFFENVLRKSGGYPHPYIYLRGMQKEHLEAILGFLYKGETSVQKINLDSFLALARELGVRGFCEVGESELASTPGKEETFWEVSVRGNTLIEDTLEYNTQRKESISGNGQIQMANNDYEEDDTFELDEVDVTADTSRFVTREKGKPGKPALKPDHEISHVWKFVEEVDKNFMCNMCGITFEYFHHVQTHLLNAHSDNNDIVELVGGKKMISHTQEESMFPNNLYVPRITYKKSPAWKFCQKVDALISKCLFCNKMLGTKGGTTKPLIHHLKTLHFDNANVISSIEERILEMKTDKQKKNKQEVDQSKKTEDNMTISIGKFAKKMEDKTAQCALCDSILIPKYQSTEETVLSHLTQFHRNNPDVIETLKEISVLKNKKEKKKTNHETPEADYLKTIIWIHFDRYLRNLYAKCKVCPYAVFKLQDGDSPELKNHIVTKHPDLIAHDGK